MLPNPELIRIETKQDEAVSICFNNTVQWFQGISSMSKVTTMSVDWTHNVALAGSQEAVPVCTIFFVFEGLNTWQC